MLDRRELMKRAGMAALATGFASTRAFALDTVTLPFDNGERPLVTYPQNRPMIGLTSRPPQLETRSRSSTTGRSRRTTRSSCAIIWRTCRSRSIPTSSRLP